MSDLLTAEEKSALQEPFGALREGARVVTAAVFPSVSQLDPDRAAALSAGLKRWLEALARELSTQLRVACAFQVPCQQTIAGESLLTAEEELFWGRIDGYPESYLLLSLPARFATALCERLFGAPLQLPEERSLTPAEHMMLRDLARGWLTLFAYSWKGVVIRSCEAPQEAQLTEGQCAPNWLRFTSDLACGPVEGAISLTVTPFTARLLLGDVGPAGADALSPASVAARLGEVALELRVVLGQAEFSVDELTSLQVGDVIALERRAPDPVDILIEDRRFCRARAGLSGQRVAFELLAENIEETIG